MDNEPVCKDDCTGDEPPGGTDTDPSFTDIEIDDQDDFSDDSDYGLYICTFSIKTKEFAILFPSCGVISHGSKGGGGPGEPADCGNLRGRQIHMFEKTLLLIVYLSLERILN